VLTQSPARYTRTYGVLFDELDTLVLKVFEGDELMWKF